MSAIPFTIADGRTLTRDEVTAIRAIADAWAQGQPPTFTEPHQAGLRQAAFNLADRADGNIVHLMYNDPTRPDDTNAIFRLSKSGEQIAKTLAAGGGPLQHDGRPPQAEPEAEATPEAEPDTLSTLERAVLVQIAQAEDQGQRLAFKGVNQLQNAASDLVRKGYARWEYAGCGHPKTGFSLTLKGRLIARARMKLQTLTLAEIATLDQVRRGETEKVWPTFIGFPAHTRAALALAQRGLIEWIGAPEDSTGTGGYILTPDGRFVAQGLPPVEFVPPDDDDQAEPEPEPEPLADGDHDPDEILDMTPRVRVNPIPEAPGFPAYFVTLFGAKSERPPIQSWMFQEGLIVTVQRVPPRPEGE